MSIALVDSESADSHVVLGMEGQNQFSIQQVVHVACISGVKCIAEAIALCFRLRW